MKEYLRELGTFVVEVKDVCLDTPSPNKGSESAIAVLETVEHPRNWCRPGLLIDAKWRILNWDYVNGKKVKPNFNKWVDAERATFKVACGLQPTADAALSIGKRLIIQVKPRDENGKRYWNVVDYFPMALWAEQFPGDSNFGTEQGVGF